MLTIKRIGITEGQGHCGDKVYPFVRDTLKRRYGNSVTFCFDWEVDKIIQQFKDVGFIAYDDNFIIKVTEPSDFKVDGLIYCEGMIGDIPMTIKEIKDDNIHGRIAKVKYVNYPRKHGIWIKVKTQGQFENEILKYGEGLLEALKENQRISQNVI
jgi:hypothetical protein